MTERDELLLSMMIQDAYRRPVTTPETLIRGDIKHFHFPDLLLYLRRIQATGVLHIVREKVRKKVYISAGVPTAAQSNLKQELLGEFLVSRGAITQDQQKQALRLHVEKQINFAAAAMEMGAIGREDLFKLARQHFLTILYSLFGLKNGTYRFDEQELPQVLFCYQVSFSRMLVFGMRLISDRQVLLDMLGDLNKVAVPTDRFSEHTQIMFIEKERAVIDRIDGKRALKEIVESSHAPSLTAMKALLILLYHGLVRFEVELDAKAVDELVDLEASDAELLGFQAYQPGRPDEEESVAGDDFLIPPYGISAEREEPSQGAANRQSQRTGATDLETELPHESVLRVDRLFSEQTTWIDTLLWGVAPVAPQTESWQTKGGGELKKEGLVENLSPDPADALEPEPSDEVTPSATENPSPESEQRDESELPAATVSATASEEAIVVGGDAPSDRPRTGEDHPVGEEDAILNLVEPIDEETEVALPQMEKPPPDLAALPIDTDGDEPLTLGGPLYAEQPGSEIPAPPPSAQSISNLKKPMYWTAILFIVGFGLYSLSPWGSERPTPAPVTPQEAVDPAVPETTAPAERVQAEEALPVEGDRNTSISAEQDVFSVSPDEKGGEPDDKNARSEEEAVLAPSNPDGTDYNAPFLPEEAAGENQALAPENETEVTPDRIEPTAQGTEEAVQPAATETSVPPGLVVEAFRLLVNEQPTQVPAGAALVVSPGDKLVIEGLMPPPATAELVKINFVGFVGNKRFNDGEDRGYVIQSRDLLRRHALDAQGTIYRIEASAGEDRVAEIFIRIRR
ncbi:MAG: DUF4388 domain-containing protein [bacterium]|nr:DUF4388 domain-containing protein [bacterium]